LWTNVLAHKPHAPVSKVESYYFIENKGQWEQDILFKAEIKQGHVLVTKTGIVYQLVSRDVDTTAKRLSSPSNPHANSRRQKIKGQVIKASFVGSLGFSKFSGHDLQSTKVQYLKGKDASKWQRGVRTFQQVWIKDLYKGIDLKLYFQNGLLKYDFVVAAHSDPHQIAIRYDGADKLNLEDGFLCISTKLGKMYEKPPFSYQHEGKHRKTVKSSFLLEKNTLRFELSNKYDRTKPLIIDPELVFSTYSGSRADNWGNTATYDEAGNFYSGGVVFADSAFPVTPGPFQLFGGGRSDVLILKYSPDGTTLLAAAYLGGSSAEYPVSMIVNKKNELVVMGVTGSFDFPVTPSAFDTTNNGGPPISVWQGYPSDVQFPVAYWPSISDFDNGCDIFVSVLDLNASQLIGSTFFGGDATDGYLFTGTICVRNYGDQLRGEVIVDNLDNIYIVSHTYSDIIANAPFSGLHYQQNHGLCDAVVAKFNPDLSSLFWHRYVGGAGRDVGFGIRLDSRNNVFITGGTNSRDMFQGAASGVRTTFNGTGTSGNEVQDAYIAKLSADGSLLTNSTFLGTNQYDQAYFIDIDYNDDVYVFGQTRGAYPVSTGVYSNLSSGQFVHKLNNNLSVTAFSTVIGSGTGRPDISPTGFMVNNCRKIFLSGWGGRTNRNDSTVTEFFNGVQWTGGWYTNNFQGGVTANLPVTPDAIQGTSNGTGFYFMVLQPEASALAYATHFGGTIGNREHVDGGTSRFDKKGVIYQSVCAGCGGLSNFPTPIPGVWSTTNNSDNCNNASLKIDLDKVVADFETLDSLSALPSNYGCVPVTFVMKNKSSGATNYKWNFSGGLVSQKHDSIYVKFTQRGIREIILIAFDTTICRQTDTAKAIINAGDVRVAFPLDKIACNSISFVPDLKLYSPWAKVEWKPVTGLSNPNIPNPIITANENIKYTITVSDDTLCVKSDTFNITVRKTDPRADFTITDLDSLKERYKYCYPASGFFSSLSTNADSLVWREDDAIFNTRDVAFYHTFPKTGHIVYKLTVLDTICKKTDDLEKTVIVSTPEVVFPGNQMLCPDSLATVKVLGDPAYTYHWSPEAWFQDPSLQEQTVKGQELRNIVVVVTDSLGCKQEGGFGVGKYGIPDPIAEKQVKICLKKTSEASIQAMELKEYQWLPVNFTGNPFITSTPGTYYLIGTTLDGCPVQDTVKVKRQCDPELYVPTAFSPDGDGKNDFFQVFGQEITEFDIKIFDRWGEIIYHSTNYRFNWDGTYKGQIVPIGTYPYVITWSGVTFEEETVSKTFAGDVTVVR
jgi:gliding motility-associated-like protein